MPDEIFANQRLADLYDTVEGDRDDLDNYVSMVDEFGARSVLDVGCGTGTFACILAERGLDVVGVDPAEASLAVARRKSGAGHVRWIAGDACTLPPLEVDLATMTGNVAQVFVDDSDWAATLDGIRRAVRPSGRLVFEVRDPKRRAWEQWTKADTLRHVDLGDGDAHVLETWVDVLDVSLPMVSFRHTFQFADGSVATSESTLRFRDRDEIAVTLDVAGFVLDEVRDAPDRPGREHVFIAR